MTRSHTSLIEAALPVVKKASQMPEVSKISLGIIKQINIGKPRIKFSTITGGIKAVIRGNASIQEIFIYTKESDLVSDTLDKLFNKE